MQTTIRKQCMDYDVIIGGGGPAGCAAAVAAARMGAKTLLIERTNALGGMSTVGMVSMMAPYTDREKVIYFSVAREILERYKKRMHLASNAFDWIGLSAEELKIVYDEIVTESGVDVLFDSVICDVKTNGESIESVLVANKSGLTSYQANVYIDCTGDADIAALAGVPYEVGDADGTVQSATLCFVISNVDMDATSNLRGKLQGGKNSKWEQIVAEGKYPLVENHCAPVELGEGTIIFNAGHINGIQPTDPISLSQAIMLGRKIAQQYHEALKEYWPEYFKDSTLIATAPALGVRESRRIEGMYRLTVEDYLERKHFPDEIAWNCYWIDSHGGKLDVRIEDVHYKPGESFGIPFRCLVPIRCNNLLVAGRSISMERSVLSSVRVMPNCYATGEAAGIGAAIAAKNGYSVQDIPVDSVLTELRKNGAKF